MITLNQANNHLTYQKNLQEYKTDELDSSNKNFNSILEHSLISARLDKSESSEKKVALNDQIAASSEQAQTTSINKPNMRELVEAISGRSVEELYADPSVNWLEISAQGTELLYGVVGSGTDTRNWEKIMNSEDVLKAARLETGLMHNPKIDLISEYDTKEKIIGQIAVIKNNEGTILRSLSGTTKQLETQLANFGANENTVPQDIENLIVVDNFDDDLLHFLKNYSGKTNSSGDLAADIISGIVDNRLAKDTSIEDYI